MPIINSTSKRRWDIAQEEELKCWENISTNASPYQCG
jgi:hypothetical protein